jgi:hypothetical protein
MTETMIGVSGAYINIDETYSGAMKGMRRRTKLYCAPYLQSTHFVAVSLINGFYERGLVRQGKHNLPQDHESRNPD